MLIAKEIFLSHPFTNNRLFFLLTIVPHLIMEKKQQEKGFQKILNSLGCDMVTSF